MLALPRGGVPAGIEGTEALKALELGGSAPFRNMLLGRSTAIRR